MKKTLIIIVITITSIAFTQSVIVKNSSAETLLEINDEGTDGSSITLPSGSVPDSPDNKLYNESSTLKWGINELSTGPHTVDTNTNAVTICPDGYILTGSGSCVTIPTADNLGNHIATQDINMAGYEVSLNGGWLSGDGDNEGVYVNDNGSVGIGTTTSARNLNVGGDIGVDGAIYSTSSIGTGILNQHGLPGIWVGSGGDVGIGDITPSYNLELDGWENSESVMYIKNNCDYVNSDGLTIAIATFPTGDNNDYVKFVDGNDNLIGSIDASGTGGIRYNVTSDARLKKNITNFNGGLNILSKINVKKYEMINNPGKTQIGFLAQELSEVYPQAVSGSPYSDVNEDPMMIDYGQLTPILVKAIQEQQMLIKEQQKQIDELKQLIGG